MPDDNIVTMPARHAQKAAGRFDTDLPNLDVAAKVLDDASRSAADRVITAAHDLDVARLLEPGEMQELTAISHALNLAADRITGRLKSRSREMDEHARDSAIDMALSAVLGCLSEVYGPRGAVDEIYIDPVAADLVATLRRHLRDAVIVYENLPEDTGQDGAA